MRWLKSRPAKDRTVSHAPLSLGAGVSVLVPTFQASKYLQGCLDAIWAQTYAGPLEIIVADGGSTDGTREIADRAIRCGRRLRLVDNPERAQAAGLNRAARAAIYPLLIRCDAQARLPPNAIELMILEHRSARGLNVGGIQAAVPPETPVGRALAVVYNTWIGSGGAAYRTATGSADVDTVYLGSWRRDELLAVGGWSTAVGCTEDAELNLRWRRLGGRVRLLPQISVAYLPRTSFSSLFHQYSRYGYWRTRTAARHRTLALRQALALTPLAAALILPFASMLPVLALPAIFYGLAVSLQGLRKPASGVRPLVPLVLTTMHLAWGAGFVVGLLTLPLRRPVHQAEVAVSLR